MTDIIGGALMALGGGLHLAYAFRLLRYPKRGRDSLPELAIAYPVRDDTPADFLELVDRLR